MPSLHQFDWSVRDIQFVLWDQFQVQDRLLDHPALIDLGINRELLDTLLTQAQQFAIKELDPIDIDADQEGCHLDEAGRVKVPTAFSQTWKTFVQAGWTELSKPLAKDISLPLVARQAYLEILFGACPSFMMYGGFGMPIAQLIREYGDHWQNETFVDRLLSLEWGGCFCMTEPGAGSDAGSLRTRAIPNEDGSYRIEGEKIFITAGMHDLVENLVYLVVARTPDAPSGTPGLSCFLVPRLTLPMNGDTPTSNGVTATRIEKKMGLSGCATTALSFGMAGPCTGYLLGAQPNTGLKQLSSLMALARMSTGLIGLGIASKAYQNAVQYAHQRQQGTHIRQALNPKAPKVAIIEHADVRNMLLEMKAKVEGCRSLTTKLAFHYTALQQNVPAVSSLDDDEKHHHDRWVALLTPLVKAYISDQSWRISELAIQVYGGHGYIRDNPVEQSARDCKILSIWEGTNFLQSAELIREKCAMGRKSPILDQAIHAMIDFLETSGARDDFNSEARELERSIQALQDAHKAIGAYTKAREIDHVFFTSTRYLKLLAETLIAWLLLDGAVIAKRKLATTEAGSEAHTFLLGRIASMQYFTHYILPIARSQAGIIQHAPTLVNDITPDMFT